jgi:hypothetical protein
MELTLNMEQEGYAGVALQTNKEKEARCDSPAYWDCFCCSLVTVRRINKRKFFYYDFNNKGLNDHE